MGIVPDKSNIEGIDTDSYGKPEIPDIPQG
jgi:hypothetical protein